MGRRKVREEKSKLLGTKHTLKLLNRAAHSVAHEDDVSLPGGSATGYTLFWSSNSYLRQDDFSQDIYAPEDGTIEGVYVSLPIAAVNTFEVDVYKNGSTIFTTGANRPKVLLGDSLSADALPDITDVLARDYFTIQIVAPGGNYGRAIVYIVVS
jgi:hypothetical protein